MFGDDPNPTVTTAQVESGIAFGRALEGFDALFKEGFRGLAVGSGLCRWSREEKEGSPAHVSGYRKRPTYD